MEAALNCSCEGVDGLRPQLPNLQSGTAPEFVVCCRWELPEQLGPNCVQW